MYFIQFIKFDPLSKSIFSLDFPDFRDLPFLKVCDLNKIIVVPQTMLYQKSLICKIPCEAWFLSIVITNTKLHFKIKFYEFNKSISCTCIVFKRRVGVFEKAIDESFLTNKH